MEVVIQFTARQGYLRFVLTDFLALSCRFLDLSFRAEGGTCFLLAADVRRLESVVRTPDAGRRMPSTSDAISTAASAASNPLLPIFNPARSIACSKVSHVSTPKACGTPVSCADCPIPRVTSFTITS